MTTFILIYPFQLTDTQVMANTYIRLSIIITLSMLFFSCNQDKALHTNQVIDSSWQFRQVTDTNWMPAEVPGTVHTDLMKNGVIEDPYYRLNERDVQWVDKTDWEYATIFTVEKETIEKDVIELVFNGLDTYAKVYLNDQLILDADNMFIYWKVECKDKLILGENSLRIVFESPINQGLLKRENLGYFLPGAENDQSELGGLGDKKVCVFTRKPGYHFGWDWGPRLVSSGIWQDIELWAWDKATIADINIIQNELVSEKAVLNADIEIVAHINTSLSIVGTIDNNIVYTDNIDLSKGINRISIPLEIISPELWWPNGLGDQKLYDIEFKLKDNFNIISSKAHNIGLRTIEIVQEPDSIGKSFYFKVNGHPVFMKGANYIPQDIFLNRPGEDKYAMLIKSAVDANFNMLRIWGGGIYEKDIFYDLCDEAGILVWQDFMFACAMYPGNEEFIKNVEKEAIQNVKRLRNHPSIALWCGDNEILSAWNRWGWKENVLENQGQEIVDTVWNAYDTVFHNILPDVVQKFDPQRLYWSSSPSSGFGELENGKSGDNHYWGVWWAKEPFSKYNEEIPRFMSEFGFQSFPQFSSVKKYTIEEDWDIYSEVMKSHQRSSIGNVTIEEYMIRDYKKPMDFEMFLYVGQLLQARGISIGIEAQRRAMPYCMGSLYWQLNDCWPVASWSGIDYYGNWKALHYSVKKAFNETLISTVINENNIESHIVNDKLDDINGILKIQVMDFKGNIHYENTESIVVGANSSRVYFTENMKNLLSDLDKSKLLIYTQLTSNDTAIVNNEIKYFVSPKDLDLPECQVSYNLIGVENEIYTLEISTDNLAKNIFLQTPFEGHFSDNYFDLLPGQTKTVTYYSPIEINEVYVIDGISIYTLIDSYKK